jgi:hypothetical protein
MAVAAGLEAVAGPGWQLELVGGGRRSSAFHDAGGPALLAVSLPW